MTSYSDRIATKTRIVEVLTHAPGLEAVQVEYSYPGDRTTHEVIWLGHPTGNRATVDFGVPGQGTDDVWTLDLVVAVAGRATIHSADVRCQELIAAIDAALFRAPRLGVSWPAVYPGRLDGPSGFRPHPHEPAASVAELTIEIHAPLRGA